MASAESRSAEYDVLMPSSVSDVLAPAGLSPDGEVLVHTWTTDQRSWSA